MEAAPVGHEGDQGEGERAARQRVADAQQGALGEVPEIRGNKWGYSSCGALLGPEMILVRGLVNFVSRYCSPLLPQLACYNHVQVLFPGPVKGDQSARGLG